MNNPFLPEFFQANRARLKTLFVGTAPIIVTANGVLQRSGDNPYRFRQDSNFWYLTGINDPDFVLVMDKDKEYLIAPQQSDYQHAFDGTLNFQAVMAASGISDVLDYKAGWKQLAARIKKSKHVATFAASPAYIADYGMYTNPARARLIKKIKNENDSVELLDLRQHMVRLRMVKQAPEMLAINHAVDLTIQAFSKVKRNLQKYQYEYQIDAEFTNHFTKNGFGNAYYPIVASGENACILHYQDNTSLLSDKDLVLMDVGAEVFGYSADISRTYALGELTKRQQQIWQAVMDVRSFALNGLKPGVTILQNEKLVQAYMGEKLRELGVIKTIDKENVRQFFPHATSHFMGLDTHDAADYHRPLEEGMVLTVEPGIYIKSESIGIRIEDDIVITADGHDVIGKNLPTAL